MKDWIIVLLIIGILTIVVTSDVRFSQAQSTSSDVTGALSNYWSRFGAEEQKGMLYGGTVLIFLLLLKIIVFKEGGK